MAATSQGDNVLSESNDSSDNKQIAREQEVETLLERKFQHVDSSHPAMQVLMKEARRHWLEALRERDED